MINKGLQTPTAREVLAAADLFDQMGDFESAALLDEYLEQTAEYDGDIIKLAGFWANVWKRMKGKAKMWFYNEYKELFQAAKEAQEKLQERMKEAKIAVKELKSNINNHELQDWRLKLGQLKFLNTSDITQKFDGIYGRFLNYILKFKDQQEESEKSLEQMTPSEKIESMTGSGTSGVKWLPVDRKEGQQKIFVSSDETMVRIDRERAPHYTRLMRPVKGKSPEYRRLQEDARLNVMKAVFGNSIWKIIKETEKYTYYKEVPEATETTEEKKPEVPGKPEVSKPVIPIRPDPTAFRAPKLPIDTPDLSKATKRMESVTDLFEDEDDLESELLGKKEAPKAEKPKEEAPKTEKPKEEAPKAEKPAEGKKKEGLQRVWVELTGGNQLAKVKKENPAARLFTFMQRKGMKETHRVLDPENEADAKIQGFLEMQGPAAKTVNKYTPLILESKEKTASRKSRRDKLISLISK